MPKNPSSSLGPPKPQLPPQAPLAGGHPHLHVSKQASAPILSGLGDLSFPLGSLGSHPGPPLPRTATRCRCRERHSPAAPRGLGSCPGHCGWDRRRRSPSGRGSAAASQVGWACAVAGRALPSFLSLQTHRMTGAQSQCKPGQARNGGRHVLCSVCDGRIHYTYRAHTTFSEVRGQPCGFTKDLY